MDRRPGGVWLAAGAITGALATGGLVLAGSQLLATSPPPAMGPPFFIQESAGVDHTYDGEFNYFVGGGVAVFDCDANGKPDLFFAGGSNPAGLYRNQSPVGGRLDFVPVPGSGTDLTRVTGAYPLDVDGDDLTDLAVLRLGSNTLLRGLGDCRFQPANADWGVDGGDEWTVAFSAKWDSGSEWPTLAFGNYLDLTDGGERTGRCSDNVMLRPLGTTGYGPGTTLTPGWCTLSILFSDWDRSGRGDLRMTNDRHYYREGEEQLWKVAPGQDPRLYTHEEGWERMQIWGMGIASHDLTGDGLPEVFLTSQGDNKLQTLADGPDRPAYTDIAFERGVTAHRPFAGDTTSPSTAWHAEWEDVNNDSYIDLFIAKGNVEAMPDFARKDPNNLLLGRADGTFRESAGEAGILGFASTRGAALADLNLDGMLDLVEVNRREPVGLWRNVGGGNPAGAVPMGNWIALKLQQPGSNRDGIGSWIEVKVGDRITNREVTVGGGHAGGQLGWMHFGLGAAERADIRVQWPDGERGPWLTMPANEFGEIHRGTGEVRGWRPD